MRVEDLQNRFLDLAGKVSMWVVFRVEQCDLSSSVSPVVPRGTWIWAAAGRFDRYIQMLDCST
jgi:hypothetical protein